jgi:hypothetical protein
MHLGTVYFYQISARSGFIYGCQVAILENQLRGITLNEWLDQVQISEDTY